jgi:hypothetical protein
MFLGSRQHLSCQRTQRQTTLSTQAGCRLRKTKCFGETIRNRWHPCWTPAQQRQCVPAHRLRLWLNYCTFCLHHRFAVLQTATHHNSPGDKLQVDSSFMSCGSSADTMSRFVLFPSEDGPAPSVPSKSATEQLVREVLVINGLPLEARATAMGAWMKKAQRYGNDFYNRCVSLAVSMLSTMVRATSASVLAPF